MLLDKLRLVEGDYLKRAAALLFHPDPERFVTGAYIKIGYFREHADLIYQDEVHGSLFQQVRQTMDLLTTKYMRALIGYEGIQRIETLPIPREALREALLNSVVHKAYESLTPIQIAVYDNKLEIFNCGYLPENWTIEDLLGSHRSRPYNPDIANAFFRAGEIETWGRGIERIINGCKDAGCPEPTFECKSGEIWTVFHYGEIKSVQKNVQKSVQKSVQKIVSLIKANPHITTQAIADQLGINRSGVARHIKRLQEQGIIRRIGPDKGGYWEVINVEE